LNTSTSDALSLLRSTLASPPVATSAIRKVSRLAVREIRGIPFASVVDHRNIVNKEAHRA